MEHHTSIIGLAQLLFLVPFVRSTRAAVACLEGGILRCGWVAAAAWKAALHEPQRFDHERSGTDDDADGCRGGAGSCGSGGCGIFVGFLVSGRAEYGDSRAEARNGDAAGSAAGAWQNRRGESVCDAGFLSAPGDTAVLWAAGWESGGVLLPRMAVRCFQRAVR